MAELDYITGLASIILILVFGLFTPFINCDLQELLENIYAKHVLCFICVFFLIGSLVAPNQPLWKTWLQTFYLYVLFVLATKSTIWFVMINLILILIDQSINMEMKNRKIDNPNADVSQLQKIRD